MSYLVKNLKASLIGQSLTQMHQLHRSSDHFYDKFDASQNAISPVSQFFYNFVTTNDFVFKKIPIISTVSKLTHKPTLNEPQPTFDPTPYTMCTDAFVYLLHLMYYLHIK